MTPIKAHLVGAGHFVLIDQCCYLAPKNIIHQQSDFASPRPLSRLAGHIGDLGDRGRGFEFLERIERLAPDDGLILYNSACAYSSLGELDRAIECLRKALDLGFKNTVIWVEYDPDLKDVREHPKYQALIAAKK